MGEERVRAIAKEIQSAGLSQNEAIMKDPWIVKTFADVIRALLIAGASMPDVSG